MSSIQILTIFVPHCPPATAGPISQVNTNSGQEPIVLSHYIHNVLCTQKEKLYCIVVTVLVIREVWKMILKPSRRCNTWGSRYFPSPRWLGTTGSPAPPVDTRCRHTGCCRGDRRCWWTRATFQELSWFSLHVTFHYTTAALHERQRWSQNRPYFKKRCSWLLSNRLSIDQPINSTSTIHSAGLEKKKKSNVFDFTGLLTLEDKRTSSIIAFLRFPWLLVTVSLAVSSFMHVDDPTLGKWLLPGRCRAVAALASPLSFRLVILFHPPTPPSQLPVHLGMQHL